MTMSPETKRRVTETIERIRESRPKAYGAMSPHVMEFARQFFPDISEATAQRNCLDIMNCMSTVKLKSLPEVPTGPIWN